VRILERCHAIGCNEYEDPRWGICGPRGYKVPACDGHGTLCRGNPCTCPPARYWDACIERDWKRLIALLFTATEIGALAWQMKQCEIEDALRRGAEAADVALEHLQGSNALESLAGKRFR